MPLTVIGVTFQPHENLGDLTRIQIVNDRVHLYIGTNSFHMTFDQCVIMLNKIHDAMDPLLKEKLKTKAIGIEVSDTMNMKDSI